MENVLFILIITLLLCIFSNAQYEDERCKCVCPDTNVIDNTTKSDRKVYIKNFPPAKCNCVNVVIPDVAPEVQKKAAEFCPLCECKYESRNTATIKIVVIIIICIILLLVVYMLFLMCLDPVLNKRPLLYLEQKDEDVAHIVLPVLQKGVLNRVGHQQNKWKQQVQEQRRNIYDKHTMLN